MKRDSFSVSITVGAYGSAFGAAAVAADFSVLQACLLSLLLFSGASQFAVVGVIAAGGTAINAIATSTTGNSFTAVSGSTSIFSTYGLGVASNGSQFVAVGQGTNTVASSSNGTTWTGQVSTFSSGGRGIIWIPSLSLWIAGGATTNTLIYSSNGTTWTNLGASIFSSQGNGFGWNGV